MPAKGPASTRRWPADATRAVPYADGDSAQETGFGGRTGLAERGPQVGGGPFGLVDVDLDAGAELEAGADRQPRDDVDVPAELLGPARRVADPEVELRQRPERPGERPQRRSDHL